MSKLRNALRAIDASHNQITIAAIEERVRSGPLRSEACHALAHALQSVGQA